MPPTTENIPEKPPFDVYAMMLILGFVFTVGATLLLNDDLDKNWGFWEKKEESKRAVHITEINETPDKFPDLISVRDIDLKEWAIAVENQTGKKAEFPEKDFKWPEGYDSLANPVVPGEDNLSKIPEAQRNALMKNYDRSGAPKPSTEPKAEPKADAPTEQAPEAAPKVD